MSVTFFAGNLLEGAAAITEASVAAPRLADNARTPAWTAAGTGVRTVTIDLGAARSVSAWALVNHNAAAAVQVLSSPDGATWTSRDSATPSTAVFLHAFTLATARYWQVQVSAGPAAAAVGELVLGEPITLPNPQVPPGYQDRVLGNVRRDYSPAGYSWAVKRGASRREFRLGFNAMDEATLALLRGAYAACDEGALKFVYLDHDGQAWWVEWVDDALEASLSAAVYDGRLGRAVTTITLREAL